MKKPHAVAQIAKLRAYLESGLESIPDGVVMLDTRGRFVYANTTTLKKLGRREKDLIGKTLSEISPPFMSPKMLRIVSERIKYRLMTGKPTTGAEMELVGKGGKPLHVCYSASVVRDDKGKIVGELVFLKDITEIKRMHEALLEAEKKYRSLFENANDAIIIADTETGRLLDANKAAEKMLGRPKKEIIGAHQSTLHPTDKIKHYTKSFKKDVRSGRRTSFGAEVVTKSGRIVPVSISAAVTTIGGRRIIQGIFRDMTELKRAEEERKKLTKELVTVSGNVTEAVKNMSAMYRKRIDELEKLVAQLSKK